MLKEVSYQRPILVQVKEPKPLPTESILVAKKETISPRDSVINYEELYSVGQSDPISIRETPQIVDDLVVN